MTCCQSWRSVFLENTKFTGECGGIRLIVFISCHIFLYFFLLYEKCLKSYYSVQLKWKKHIFDAVYGGHLSAKSIYQIYIQYVSLIVFIFTPVSADYNRSSEIIFVIFISRWLSGPSNYKFSLNFFFLAFVCGFQALFHKQLSSDWAVPDRVPQHVRGLHSPDHLFEGHWGPGCCPPDPPEPHCVGDRRTIFPAQTGRLKSS